MNVIIHVVIHMYMTDHFGSYFYVINYTYTIFTSVDRQIDMFCKITFNLTQISDAFLQFFWLKYLLQKM